MPVQIQLKNVIALMKNFHSFNVHLTLRWQRTLDINFHSKKTTTEKSFKIVIIFIYGKFQHRTNMKKIEFVTDVGVPYSFFTDASKVVTLSHYK